MRGFSMYQYMRSRAAAERRRVRENERYWKNIQKLQEKQLREIQRDELKRERARIAAIKAEEKKQREAERIRKSEEKIEARLRKMYGLPKDGTLVVVVETENRLLEI